MKKNLVIIGILLVFILVFFSGCTDNNTDDNDSNNGSSVGIKTIYVDDDGGKDYTSIQKAIDAANDGDTVYVYNGIYIERLKINKSVISLVGEDNEKTSINGCGTGPVSYVGSTNTIKITVDGVTVDNFKIVNTKNDITSHGISIHSNNNTIKNCKITGLANGIYFEKAKNNKIIGNNISSNVDEGIHMFGSKCEDNEIYGNIISGSLSGIFLFSSKDITIFDNTISNNYRSIYTFSSTKNIVAYHNNFINNDEHGDGLKWYNNDTKEGNYWSDYAGNDDNGDGIGDTAYDVPGTNKQDLYPLINPVEV